MDLPTIIFLVTTVIKSVVLLKVLLGVVSYTVMAERVVSAAIQDRIGPNRVGVPLGGVTILGFKIPNWSLFGLGQPIADALKFMFKEDFTPAFVNKTYYWMAPAMAMAPALITLCAIPYASVKEIVIPVLNLTIPQPGVIANIDVGLLFIFAITSLSVYGIVMAGWASNSKYSFLGGIRSSAQMISYEIAMGLAVVPILLAVGKLNLSEIIQYQIDHGWILAPFMTHSLDWKMFALWPCFMVSFLIFLVASFAETNRTPFDLPESETELIGGYHTEYSSMKFALFFLGEYAAMIVASGLMVTLFLGGWSLPLPWFDGSSLGLFGGINQPWWFVLFVQPLIFFAKVACFLLLFIWVRWTVPRFRYDQLMGLGWKIFLPIALINVMVAATILAFIK